jgi:hypothetical protein
VAALSAAASAGQDEKQKALADAHDKVASLQREVSHKRQQASHVGKLTFS